MNLNGVEISKDIIDAINNNKLVVFAGAGVSMGHPTNLPSFKQITEHFSKGRYDHIIASSDTYTEDDQYLGRLENENIYVHNIISNIFGSRKIEPNAYHQSLINLFNNNNKLRIVTTNYDTMLEKVCRNEGIEPKVYSNPALPYGNDFEGIVHLHGVIDDPKNLVVTDKDFGKVYMYHSNATKFLLDLFNSDYVILFVGYSYNDLIMRYFTKAIPETKSKRYIFVDERTIDDVKSMGLIPVKYEIDDFASMYGAIKKLGDFVNRDAFSWEKRIIEISNTNPSFIDLQTEGEIRHIFSNVHLLAKLTKNINSLGWLIYFNYKGYLKNIFSNEIFTDHDYILSKWILDNFLVKDFQEFKYLLVKNKFNLNIEFQKMIMEYLDKIDDQVIEEILSFIKIDGMDKSILTKVSDRLKNTDLNYYKIKVIKSLLKFTYKYRKLSNFLEYDQKIKGIEIIAQTLIDRHEYKHVEDLCLDLNHQVRNDLLVYMNGQIVNLYHKSSLGDVSINFSNYSVFTDNVILTTIDAYLVLFIKVANSIDNKDFTELWIDEHINSSYPALRRLARKLYVDNFQIDGLDILFVDDNDQENKETIKLLEDKDLPENLSLQVEVMTDKSKSDNQFVTINKNDLKDGMKTSIDHIINNSNLNRSRDSIFKDISDLASEDLEYALKLIEYLSGLDQYSGQIWSSILKGLSENSNIVDNLNLFSQSLNSKILENQTYPITLFIKRIVEKTSFNVYTNRVDHLIDLIERLLGYAKDYEDALDQSWSDITFNSSNGVLAHIMVRLIQKIDQEKIDNKNLSKEEIRLYRLIELVLDSQDSYDAKFVIIGNFSIFYNIDDQWAKKYLLPFFENSDCHKFRTAWTGFLTFSRIYPQISLVMDPFFRNAVLRLDQIDRDGKFRREFIKLYTVHFIASEDNPQNYYIPALFRLKNEDICVFYSALNSYLEESNEERKDVLWKTWLREFIERRLDNIPTKLQKEEISHILQLLLTMGQDNWQIIDKIPIYVNQKFDFIKDLDLDLYTLEDHDILLGLVTYMTNTMVKQRDKQPDRKLKSFIGEVLKKVGRKDLPSDLEYNLSILGI